MKDVPFVERAGIRKCFTDLVDVLHRHRDAWCREESSNRAVSRLTTSVEILMSCEPVIDPLPASYMKRDKDLVALVNRLDRIYDRLERPTMAAQEAMEALRLLPARSAMPAKPADFLRFAERACLAMLEHEEAFERGGITPNQVQGAVNGLERCHEQQRKRMPQTVLKQHLGIMSSYQRTLNACIRNLIERVDPVMPRYRDHAELQADYAHARARIAELPILMRYTFHVDGVGRVSGMHRDALKPWPGNLDRTEYPTSDELQGRGQ